VTYLSLYLLYNAHSVHITDCAVCKDGYISIGSYSCSACNGTADKITIGVFITILVIAVLGSWYMINDLLALDDLDTASTSASSICTSAVQAASRNYPER
jgi:hypothetical protein